MDFDPFNKEEQVPDWVGGTTETTTTAQPITVGAPIQPQVQQVVQSAPVPQQPQTVQQQMASCPATDFDFSEIEGVEGIEVGTIGAVKVNDFPVEKMKFTKDTNSLISIVSDKCVSVNVHYNDVSHGYLCWHGKCCELDGYSKKRFLFPIVVYDTDKKGTPISGNLEYKVLVVGKDSYNDLITKMELNGNLTSFDILVSCEDEQYQKLKFNLAGGARWKKNPQRVTDTMNFWKENIKHIVKPIAKKITEEQLILDKGAAVAQSTAVQPRGEVNFTDVFSPAE